MFFLICIVLAIILIIIANVLQRSNTLLSNIFAILFMAVLVTGFLSLVIPWKKTSKIISNPEVGYISDVAVVVIDNEVYKFTEYKDIMLLKNHGRIRLETTYNLGGLPMSTEKTVIK